MELCVSWVEVDNNSRVELGASWVGASLGDISVPFESRFVTDTECRGVILLAGTASSLM